MTLPTQCRHYRNTVTHDVCGAGVRYAGVSGADRDGLAKAGLPCWYGPETPVVGGGVRFECALYEATDAG